MRSGEKMSEFRRICAGPRFLGCFLAVFLLNALLAAGGLWKDSADLARWSGVSPWTYLKEYRVLTEECAERTAEELSEEVSLLETEYLAAGGAYPLRLNLLKNTLLPQVRRREAYPERLEAVREQAERLTGISLFADPDSYTYRNILKTAADFEKLSGVSLRAVNELPVRALSDGTGVFLLSFLFCLFLLTQIIEEPHDSLRRLLRQTPGGGVRLSARRFAILSLAGCVCLCLLTAQKAVLVRLIAGGTDLSAPVQSVSFLQDVVIPVSIGGYLLILLGLQLVGLLLLNGSFWLVQSLFRRPLIGTLAAGALLGAEFILSRAVPVVSRFRSLKAVNLWTPAFIHTWFEHYTNLDVFGRPVQVTEAAAAAALLLIFPVTAVCILLDRRRRGLPAPGTGRIIRGLQRFLRRLAAGRGSLRAEAVRLYVSGKRWLILAAGILVMWQLFPQSGAPNPYAQDYVEWEIRKINGSFDDPAVTEALEAEEASVTAAVTEYEAQRALYEEGKLTEEEWQVLTVISAPVFGRQTALQTIRALQEYSSLFRERTGRSLWLILGNLFDHLAGSSRDRMQRFPVLAGAVMLILILGTLFSGDRRSGMDNVLAVTRAGKRGVFARRQIVALCTVLLVWGIVYGLSFRSVYRMYPFSWWKAPIQSLEAWRTAALPLTCGQFLALIYLLRLVFLTLFAEAILFISAHSKTDRAALLTESSLLVPLTAAVFLV